MPKLSPSIRKYTWQNKDLFSQIASVVVIVANLSQYALKPSGFPQGDSWAYGFGSENSKHLISLTGHALRKWPMVLTNYVLQDDSLRVGMQTLLSIVAWTLLIRECATFKCNRKLSILLVTSLAISPQIISWNSIQLSESYAISTGVLTLIFARRNLLRKKKINLALLGIFLFLFLNTKPSNFLSTVVIICLSIFLLILPNIRKHFQNNLKVVLILIFILGYTGLMTLNQAHEKLQLEGFGESYSAAQAVAVISNVNPYSKQINSRLLNIEVYDCLGDVSGVSPITVTEKLKFDCPKTENWLTDNFQRWYISYILSHPQYAVKLGAVALAIGNSPYSMYGGSLSIGPQFLTDIYFGSRNVALRLAEDSAQNIDLSKLQLRSPILIWIALILGRLSYSHKFRFRKNPKTNLEIDSKIAIMCVAVGMVMILISSLSIPNEWFRQSIVGQISIFLGGIFLLSNFEYPFKFVLLKRRETL